MKSSMLTAALAGGAAAAAGLLAQSVIVEPIRIANAHQKTDARRSAYKEDTGASATAVLTNCQGLKLFVRHWRPEPGEPVRGLVAAAHGMTVHGGPLGPLAEKLAAQGLAVVAHDQQGHGLSDGADGLRGYARAFSDFVDDAVQVLEWAQEQHPGVPVFLLGESMGGAVVLQALRRGGVRGRVRGAVLLAPAIRVSPAVLPPKPVMAVMRGLARLFPRLAVPDDKITNPAKWSEAFGDSAFAEAALRDPLFTLAPPRLAMLGWLPVWEDLYANLEDISTPFLVAHSPADDRCEYGNSVALVERAGAADKELLAVPGGRHMLLQDTPDITPMVMERIVWWLVARC